MTSEIIRFFFVLLAVSLVRVSHQQDHQFLFNNQQPSYVPEYNPSFQQFYRPTAAHQTFNRNINFNRDSTYNDQDLKTSDISFNYHSQFPQYQQPIQRPLLQFGSSIQNEPYSFQDQRFGHIAQQPFTFPPPFQQHRPISSTISPPIALTTRNSPQRVQLGIKFPPLLQSEEEVTERVDSHHQLPVKQSAETNVLPLPSKTFRQPDILRTRPASNQKLINQAESKPLASQNLATTERLPVRGKTVYRGRPLRPGDRGRIKSTDDETLPKVRNNHEEHATRQTFRRLRPVSTTTQASFAAAAENDEDFDYHSSKDELRKNHEFLTAHTIQKLISTTTTTTTGSSSTVAPINVSIKNKTATATPLKKFKVPFEDEEPIVDYVNVEHVSSSTASSQNSLHLLEDEDENEDEDYSTEHVEEAVTTATPEEQKDHQIAQPQTADSETLYPTESWVIVASVQTSRSVSGARFLPSGIVNQLVRNETLNNDSQQKSDPKQVKGTDEDISLTTVLIQKNSTPSTESIIDKLDRVQSELSSGIFSSGFRNSDVEVLTEMPTIISINSTSSTTSTTEITPLSSSTKSAESEDDDEGEPVFVRKFSPAPKTTTAKPKFSSLLDNLHFDDLTGLLPAGFKPRSSPTFKKHTTTEAPRKEKPVGRTNNFKPKSGKKIDETQSSSDKNAVQNNAPTSTEVNDEKTDSQISKQENDSDDSLPKNDSNGKKAGSKSLDRLLSNLQFEAPTNLLPPGYKKQPIEEKTGSEKKEKKIDYSKILSKLNFEEPKGLLPVDFKSQPTSTASSRAETDEKKENIPTNFDSLLEKVKPINISVLLPPNFALNKSEENKEAAVLNESTIKPNVATSKSLIPKPGSGTRKPFGRQTTEKPSAPLLPEVPKIQKGWPVRATTAFSGWPTPPTTPISIEKLLAATNAEKSSTITTTTTTTTSTTSTTTTSRPTTPGFCSDTDCELAATVKIVNGAKWVPELLDRNTREWKELANEIEEELDHFYRKTEPLRQWYKKLHIDSFSQGSVLVDYFIELKDTNRSVNTLEVKKLFHSALTNSFNLTEPYEASPNDNSNNNNNNNNNDHNDNNNLMVDRKNDNLVLGKFEIDPKFTDFIVVQKQVSPTVGYAEEETFLPQWAIAVIVIGLASLLFVIIFGVTVMVNRHKQNQKRNPTPLTEDIINEMNKQHMNGYDNYGADEFYGMDDVWNDRHYDKLPKKRYHGSYAHNSMTNLYDSWRSGWNDYHCNSYNGGDGYVGRRRSDYDTNF